MKIEKLYTLSQFIDLVETNGFGHDCEDVNIIFTYNEFLKQPLTKYMVFNDIILNSSKIEIDKDGIWFGGMFAWFNTPLSDIARRTKGVMVLNNVNLQ